MAAPLRIRSDELRRLAPLGSIHLGLTTYYSDMMRSSDPILAVGALCRLLEAGTLRSQFWDDVIALCRHDAVRTRAFAYFQLGYEHGWAQKVLASPAVPREAAQAAAMAAELALDHAGLTEARMALYLATGDTAQLTGASESAGLAGGWRAALPWALRAFLVDPLDSTPLREIYRVLDEAEQGALLGDFAELLLARNLHAAIAQIFAAGGALKHGQPAQTLARLKQIDDKRIVADTSLAPYLGTIHLLRAEAEEKLGQYKAAHDGFVALKAAEKRADLDPESFFRGIAARARLQMPALPPDARADVTQLLGFPRSGATPLGTLLAQHPAIETLTRVPALDAAIERIERVAPGTIPKPGSAEEPYLAARAKYYDELDRRRRKSGARLLIDQMPMRSADAAFTAKLFPEWRYIFAVRHPYDVALSCLRHRFSPSSATENFRTLASTARAYDRTMTQWFAQFSLDDERVCYVRYDNVVIDPPATAARVAGFLGLDWGDTRAELSPTAEGSWRNYGFVFQSKEAALLRKWAEFFDYTVQ